ncbi:MAG: ABC transporter substrate-binding protein [Pyramidobacter sp.]|uniref:ABC transporter substrate-binding protein n=1 Tax=Pyramidobacter sp. TaxID=1943581 RepID=UPI002A802D51|nr:ABC transporter substrate-binding protein [Pyramidobacter sp.]MDY4031771.1 ABC transporter substrate-binding protein [Pyramidobacter sp.]
MRKSLHVIFAALLSAAFFAAAAGAAETVYPVTVDNGNRSVTFESAPRRVVTNGDSNIIELMFALGLEDRLVGYAGFPGSKHQVSPEYREKLAKIPVAQEGYIALETLLGADPDFFLSGYNYGLDIPGSTAGNAVTPEELEKHGVKSYAITESLIRVMDKPPVTLEDTYNDLRNLGVIFNVQDKAEAVIAGMKARVAAVREKLDGVRESPRVFIFRSFGAPNEDVPRSCGGQAMPSALLRLAHAANVFDDVESSWIKVTWEEVVARDPDVILILEYRATPENESKAMLLDHPALQGVKAVRDKKLIYMSVDEVYPGPRAVRGLELIARGLYPAIF